jgi:anti-sigma regulatory factor (Ser/Thr protein kinase)
VSRLQVRLPVGLGAAAEARRAVDQLAAHLQPSVLEDVRFLVNELVTNGVKYGRGPIQLCADVTSARVRVEVVDRGAGFEPRVETPDLDQTSGRGLFLVERLADRWGVEGVDDTLVWFEIDRVPS